MEAAQISPSLPSADEAPDIETSTAGYAGRFAGEVGEYFLERQLASVLDATGSLQNGAKILEVGGGHGQLTEGLLVRGFDVTVHGSASICFDRLSELKSRFPERLHFIVSPLIHLPFQDRSFDAVIGVRLLAHLTNWNTFVQELKRVSGRLVIVDFASLASPNILTPLLFHLKKGIEKNTRTYICQWPGEVRSSLADSQWRVISTDMQFFFPMGIHRLLKSKQLSTAAESFARICGLTRLLGSPGIITAQRN